MNDYQCEKLAAAISKIDGGCNCCISSFLKNIEDSFEYADRKRIAKYFDMKDYPMKDVFEDEKELHERWF